MLGKVGPGRLISAWLVSGLSRDALLAGELLAHFGGSEAKAATALMRGLYVFHPKDPEAAAEFAIDLMRTVSEIEGLLESPAEGGDDYLPTPEELGLLRLAASRSRLEREVMPGDTDRQEEAFERLVLPLRLRHRSGSGG